MKRQLGALLLLAACCCAAAGTLERAQQRGKLLVAVKKDVPLWGLPDPRTGKLVGLEPDLAQLLGEALGLPVELVGVLSADRQEALASGRVDVVIASMSDTPERRRQLTLVAPHYYSSGANVLARKSDGFRDWSDLKNRRVCGRRGPFYNRPITVQYGIDIVPLYTSQWGYAALRESRCAALLYEDTSIAAMLQDPAWSRDFTMPLKSIFQAPWSIGLAREEQGSALEQRISDVIVGWHRSGTLRALERKWGIPPTAFLAEMHKLWNRKVGNTWYCGERVGPATPKECL